VLAKHIVDLENEVEKVAPEDRFATCRACEKIRRPLSHLVGSAGVKALLGRSLTLAKRDAPALTDVEVMDDGSFQALNGDAAAASGMIIAHLIQLLITFIGEDLTLRILYDVWPDLELLNGSAEVNGL
jgi:hypothetical protein